MTDDTVDLEMGVPIRYPPPSEDALEILLLWKHEG